VIITGHVLASSPRWAASSADRVVAADASRRGGARRVLALASSWFNWGFSLVFSAVLAIEMARRVDGVDYRALAAASMLGSAASGPPRRLPLQVPPRPRAAGPGVASRRTYGSWAYGSLAKERNRAVDGDNGSSKIDRITKVFNVAPPPDAVRSARGER